MKALGSGIVNIQVLSLHVILSYYISMNEYAEKKRLVFARSVILCSRIMHSINLTENHRVCLIATLFKAK